MISYEVEALSAKLRRDENLKQAAKILRKDRGADVSSLLEEEQSTPPTLARYIANDTNVASLGVLLQQNPNGLLVFRDEIVRDWHAKLPPETQLRTNRPCSILRGIRAGACGHGRRKPNPVVTASALDAAKVREAIAVARTEMQR